MFEEFEGFEGFRGFVKCREVDQLALELELGLVENGIRVSCRLGLFNLC